MLDESVIDWYTYQVMSEQKMTDRQQQILNAVVEEYAEVASPVGSQLLAKLFNVSSATIRSEMATLEKLGFIKQPHTSAGRIPTDKGYRFYVNKTAEGGDLHSAPREQRALTARIGEGSVPERAIRNTVDTLVELTHNLGIGTIGKQMYMSGLSNLFGQPEFIQQGQVQEVARLLDNLEPWLREAAPNKPLSVYIGKENPIGRNSGCSLIISKFRSPYSDKSFVGVLGPTRQNYKEVMALVEDAGKMLEEALHA